MSESEQPTASFPSDRRRFATTRWSLVLAAGRESSAESEAALATLCETYWYPLYAYVRRQGYDSAEAQDLTQGFFARLLEKKYVQQVQRERGRFRSFLLASLKHYIINEWDRSRAAKRGGGRKHLRVDFKAGESRYRLEPAGVETPESVFEKQWALALLEQVQEALRDEFRDAGKEDHFDRLSVYLTGETRSASYRELAAELGTTEGAVKVAVHRLRKRFRSRLREEIAQTVSSEADIDDEIRALFDALRS
jgi:RNA polymerase sigma-70 factor (ECF subfamily)